MVSGDAYLTRAAELLAKAEGETDPKRQSELENLGLAFLRLAEQARRNSQMTDVTHESPLRKLDDPELKK